MNFFIENFTSEEVCSSDRKIKEVNDLQPGHETAPKGAPFYLLAMVERNWD